MERRISMSNVGSNDEWQPFNNYRNSLLHGETDQTASTPIVVNKKVYGRKGKKNQSGDIDEADLDA